MTPTIPPTDLELIARLRAERDEARAALAVLAHAASFYHMPDSRAKMMVAMGLALAEADRIARKERQDER